MERMAIAQRDDLLRREGFARKQFAGCVRFGSRGMIHDDQFRRVEIKRFAQFLRDLHQIISVTRLEQRFVAQPYELVFVRLEETVVAQTQSRRRGAENVRDEPELRTRPQETREVRDGAVLDEAPLPVPTLGPRVRIDEVDARE